MDQEVLDARAKLAARFGKTQVGGKGMLRVWSVHLLKFSELEIYEYLGLVFSIILCAHYIDIVFLNVGTQRRTKNVVHHTEVNEDKKLKSTIKKFGMQ